MGRPPASVAINSLNLASFDAGSHGGGRDPPDHEDDRSSTKKQMESLEEEVKRLKEQTQRLLEDQRHAEIKLLFFSHAGAVSHALNTVNRDKLFAHIGGMLDFEGHK